MGDIEILAMNGNWNTRNRNTSYEIEGSKQRASKWRRIREYKENIYIATSIGQDTSKGPQFYTHNGEITDRNDDTTRDKRERKRYNISQSSV